MILLLIWIACVAEQLVWIHILALLARVSIDRAIKILVEHIPSTPNPL
jgi:hypothetical protein